MSRLPFTFACGSSQMAGTLDTAPASTGLLIVSGGSEIRSGAFRGQARIAARIAAVGFPVMRFDRRGIGDSEGEDRGFRSSAKDIASALKAFRAIAPDLERVVGFGNCDAAAALMLHAADLGPEGFSGLVLANPWTIEDEKDGADNTALPPADAIVRRYAAKLGDRREIARLLRGGVDLRKVRRGIAAMIGRPKSESALVEELRTGWDAFEGRKTILLSGADRTAQLFAARWASNDPCIAHCEGAGHAFVKPAHFDWLEARLLKALRGS